MRANVILGKFCGILDLLVLNFPSEAQAVKTETVSRWTFHKSPGLWYVTASCSSSSLDTCTPRLTGCMTFRFNTCMTTFKTETAIGQWKSLSAIHLTSMGGAWVIPKPHTYHQGTRRQMYKTKLIMVPAWDPVSSNGDIQAGLQPLPSTSPTHTLPPSAHQTCNSGTVAVTSRCSHNGTHELQKRQCTTAHADYTSTH